MRPAYVCVFFYVGPGPGRNNKHLASFKLSYVSPENHKIEKTDDENEKQKVEFGSEKTGFEIFC